jgi:hypothetical protein
MAEPAINEKSLPQGRSFVEYKNPSGGLNTRLDVHALDRNMLSISINGWPSHKKVIGKRPGSQPYTRTPGLTPGATGMGGTGTTIVATRWTIGGLSTTVLLAQNGVKLAFSVVGSGLWTNISTAMGAGAQRIHVAQMFDPLTSAIQCFICNGVDLPWMWAGPGHTTLTQTSVANGLPVNQGGSTGITPRFVATVGNNSVLVYSGEPTARTAVYVSNAFYPQAFTQSASSATNYPGSYQPYLVGYDDGVNGGAVTGVSSLQGNIMLYKESAIYRGQFVNVYGTTFGFQWQTVSPTLGMVAPESLVSFDTYEVFLSIDGVEYTDGYVVQELSTNVPTFFDCCLNGYPQLCLTDTSAVAVRMGSLYLIWYDRGLPSAPGTPAGYPTSGLWFDFNTPDVDGLPQVGEIQGPLSAYPFGAPMTVAGACSLSGPYDSGLFVWTNAVADQVLLFGLGFSEGGPIYTTLGGPADHFSQLASDSSFFDNKHVHSARLAIAAGLTAVSQPLTFFVTFVTDFLTSTYTSGSTPLIPSVGASEFGVAVFGTGTFGLDPGSTTYAPVTITPPSSVDGRFIQTIISEVSTTPWLLLGYSLEISRRLPVQ